MNWRFFGSSGKNEKTKNEPNTIRFIMCEKNGNNHIKTIFERMCIYLIHILIYLKTHISVEFKETIMYKILSKISYDIFIIILENYCL